MRDSEPEWNTNRYSYSYSCTYTDTNRYCNSYTNRHSNSYRYTDSYRYNHTHNHTHSCTDANANTDQYIRHYLLLLESSPWPRAKCDAQPKWFYVGLDIVRRFR